MGNLMAAMRVVAADLVKWVVVGGGASGAVGVALCVSDMFSSFIDFQVFDSFVFLRALSGLQDSSMRNLAVQVLLARSFDHGGPAHLCRCMWPCWVVW